MQVANCTVDVDPEIIDSPDVTARSCVLPKISLQLGMQSNDPRYIESEYGGGRFSFFLNQWMSATTSGSVHRQKFYSPVSENNIYDAVSTDAFVQFGNTSLHRHRIAMGRFEMPFAVRKKTASPLFWNWTDEAHWKTYNQSLLYTYDNFKDAIFQLGLSEDNDNRARMLLVNYIYDISALEGIRIKTSFLSDDQVRRRFALGIINLNRRRDEIHFEWIREFVLYSEQDVSPFKQIIHFAFQSPIEFQSRWRAEIQDELKIQRHVIVEYDYFFEPLFNVTAGLGFKRGYENQELNVWTFETGMQFGL